MTLQKSAESQANPNPQNYSLTRIRVLQKGLYVNTPIVLFHNHRASLFLWKGSLVRGAKIPIIIYSHIAGESCVSFHRMFVMIHHVYPNLHQHFCIQPALALLVQNKWLVSSAWKTWKTSPGCQGKKQQFNDSTSFDESNIQDDLHCFSDMFLKLSLSIYIYIRSLLVQKSLMSLLWRGVLTTQSRPTAATPSVSLSVRWVGDTSWSVDHPNLGRCKIFWV